MYANLAFEERDGCLLELWLGFTREEWHSVLHGKVHRVPLSLLSIHDSPISAADTGGRLDYGAKRYMKD